MKLISCILILSIFLTCQPLVTAQTRTPFRYDAEIIVKNGTKADKKPVVISQEDGVLKINGTKDTSISKTFLNSEIKNADYSYSEKPQIKEAIITSLLLESFLLGLPFFFTKTKKHWLVVSTEKEALLLELQRDNYRKLLFEMNANGIKVEDSGDRNSKVEPLQHPAADADFIEGESCSGDDIQNYLCP